MKTLIYCSSSVPHQAYSLCIVDFLMEKLVSYKSEINPEIYNLCIDFLMENLIFYTPKMWR